jgi:hypothetical protein
MSAGLRAVSGGVGACDTRHPALGRERRRDGGGAPCLKPPRRFSLSDDGGSYKNLSPSAALLGLADFPKVDMMDVRYEVVSIGVKTGTGSPDWSAQID